MFHDEIHQVLGLILSLHSHDSSILSYFVRVEKGRIKEFDEILRFFFLILKETANF